MESDKPLNPTVLAREFGIRERHHCEGDGTLINWETFWDLLEKTYWRNRVRRMDNASHSQLSSTRVP